jgi:hypothetical protein
MPKSYNVRMKFFATTCSSVLLSVIQNVSGDISVVIIGHHTPCPHGRDVDVDSMENDGGHCTSRPTESNKCNFRNGRSLNCEYSSGFSTFESQNI